MGGGGSSTAVALGAGVGSLTVVVPAVVEDDR